MTEPMSLADVTEAAIDRILDASDVCPKCGLPRLRSDESGSFPVDPIDPDGAATETQPPG